MKLVRTFVFGLLFCVAPAAQMLAQLHPLPASKSEPAAICTGCPSSNSSGQPNDGLPTYPYGSPIVDHTGRYVDSVNTASFQNIGFRTARAQLIRVAKERRGNVPPRMYIQIGSAVAAYTLDNFFSTKLPGGMVSISTLMSGVGGFGRTPPEKVAKWEQFFYPESSSSGWRVPFQDGQERLSDFDFDDRGYVYVACYGVFGWGIEKDDGKTDGAHMSKVLQLIPGGDDGDPTRYPKTFDDKSGVTPKSIVAFKNGSRYYAAVTDKNSSAALWDVTDTNAPRLLNVRAGKAHAMVKWDRDDATGRLAYVDAAGALHVYDYADFVSGGAPRLENTGALGKFVDLAFDESSNLWAAEALTNLWKYSPTGSAYASTLYTPYSGRTFHPNVMHVNAGHVVVAGIDRTGAPFYDVLILKVEATGPRVIDIDSFFKKYYHSAPINYAEPGSYRGIQADVQMVKSNSKTYVMYSLFGLGDVYEIQGGDSIAVHMKNNAFGTANPNAKPTTTGPFAGDLVTFTAPSSNPQVTYDVTWDFGNPEAGSSENLGRRSLSTGEITHQYTGLSTASAVTSPKLVRGVTIQDTSIGSTLNLTLKVPTPRIGITGVSTPITASATGMEIVAGNTFNDASDGSIEGHYSSWTIDAVTTKKAPNDTISVGAIGAHTLQFQGAYGKYDGSFNSTSPYLTPALTLGYTVKPFVALLNTPVKVNAGVDVKFSATAPFSANDVIAPQWTVTWKKNGTPVGAAANGISTNALVTTGTVPDLVVPMASLQTGDVISLTIDVDTAGLSVPAQPYPQAVATMTLSKPDPQINVSGCGNANSPCSFTAVSLSGASTADWTFAWTLKLNGTPVKVGTGNPFTPAVSTAGSYTIEVVATKTIFDTQATKPLTVGQSLCSPLPASTSVSITKVGCSSGCTPGTEVTFWPAFQGYSAQSCDSFAWNFGSGEGTATGLEVKHTYNTAGTFTVTLTITNPNGNLVKTTTVSVSGGTTTPPPDTCTAPTAASIVVSGCTTGGCRTTDNITFTARRGTASLQSCDNVSWTFSNGTTSTSRTPTKTFSSPGTYTASVTISNSKGSFGPVSTSVTVTAPPVGNCSTPPLPGNFAITWTAPSGCTQSNSTECAIGETVEFQSPSYFYTPAPCDNYEWDFGDSTAKVGTREATHTYATPGSYTVKFRVYNNAGSWTYTKAIKIQGTVATKPVPKLTATSFPTTGVKARTVTFTATSDMATTTGWTWSFGDGTANDTSQAGQTMQASTITHTFANKGRFTVRVTARNSEDAATAPVGAVQAQIDVADAPAIPEFVYLLPVTAHAPGQGGSKWRTDVQIYNPDPEVSEAKPLVMDASFKGHVYPLSMIKSTHIYEDFLGMLLSQQKDDQGPVIITTKSAMTPPQIWTRTYNQSENGTFGQFIPAIRLDSAGGGGAISEGKYYLAGLRHDDRYRTNVGFLNPNAVRTTATITVFDDRHVGIKQFTRTLDSFQLDQFTLKSVVPELPADRPFSLEIEVPAGQWLVAYASYIDGVSQDPVYLQAVREADVASNDFKTTIIPGVGHTGAWRSDITIFNPDSNGVQFDLQYYDSAGNKVAEAPGIVIEPFKFLQYGDILKQGVLGSAPDGLGTLKIVNTSVVPNVKQPISYARTYNDDGASGTFGQGIPAFASARANVKPNKPALLAGVRNSAEYYTNIGLVNVSDAEVTATVTLLDPVTGAAAAAIPYTLKANESIVGRFNGFGSIASGTFKIEANGNIWAFASVIDQRTKDPEYVPATPLLP